MADKYSYKPGKKKRTQKQQPAAKSVQASSAPFGTVADKSAVTEPKNVAASPVFSAKPVETGQAGVRIANLGSELKRFAILGSVIVGILVAAAFVLG